MASMKTRLFDPASDEHVLPAIVQMHIDAILVDGQSLSLLPPLTDEKVTAFWRRQIARIAPGQLDMMLAVTSDGDSDGEETVGLVCLRSSASETGPFRGKVLKLMVSLRHRRRGVARVLMADVEDLARRKGHKVLVLDTTVGGGAEDLYARLGYTECGRVPMFTVAPKTGEAVEEIYFYRLL